MNVMQSSSATHNPMPVSEYRENASLGSSGVAATRSRRNITTSARIAKVVCEISHVRIIDVVSDASDVHLSKVVIGRFARHTLRGEPITTAYYGGSNLKSSGGGCNVVFGSIESI
jgi:hypothetical protein